MRSIERQDGYSLIDIMAVVAIMGVLGAMTIPITDTSMKSQRLQGDAAALKHTVGLAKMRASSRFTRARVRVDLPTNTYRLQVWDKTGGTWVDDGGTIRTSPGVAFGIGELDAPPPDTQAAIAMSPACTDGITADGPIADTACIVFNSRGLPVDSNGNLFGGHALYLTSEIGASAVTVTATPLVRAWMSPTEETAWLEH